MSEVSQARDLVEDLAAKGSITAEDVLALRRAVFRDGVVDLDEAEAVFRLDHACTTKAPEWTQFYVDALTDFFVWQSQPSGYVNQEQAHFLIDNIAADGRVDAASEFELLLNVSHWAVSCPEELSVFALQALRESVLTPKSATYGSNRPPAVVSPSDVELIRRVIYAPGSPGGFTVTREEAELIYELYDACAAAENAPSWDDLFVKAIANFLMFPRGAPVVPNAEEALRRERWLEERRSIGLLLKSVGRESLGTVSQTVTGNMSRLREAYEMTDPFGNVEAKRQREKEEVRLREALGREAIDADEAQWLISHMKRDGVVREAERKLLQFIKQNSPSIDPAMDDLFELAGL